MLRILRRVGSRFVATTSSSARALPADDLAEIARRHFDHVEIVDDPVAAVRRAHELGDPVLVTGSLYLLGDLESGRSGVHDGPAERAARRSRLRGLIVAAIIGLAFALGYGVGKLLL